MPQIGFVGSGNMARAIALGLARPALFSDSGSGRARTLADQTGGRACSTREIGDGCDLIFLCHKPAQLAEVAGELKGYTGVLASVLAATTLAELRSAHPQATIVRLMPNTPVELRAGVTCVASESDSAPTLDSLLGELGTVVKLPESEIELATAIGGCSPAFFALFAESLINTAVTRGMNERTAKSIAGQSLLGTGMLLRENEIDTEAVQRAVASPGGLTERALKSFHQSGLQSTVDHAVATVLGTAE